MASIYIHWPFCVSKCHYCDFNSFPCYANLDIQEWYEKYLRVLRKFKDQFCDENIITSIYFGGGTPSLLPVWFVEGVISEISNNFKLINDIEITLEANPKTIDKAKAIGLKKAGVNRLSIGIQSIIDSDLRMLGRAHSAEEARECVFQLSEIFDNLSIDMIYNRPGQKLDSWKSELNEVLSYPISHISLYELIVEEGTKLKSMIDFGVIPPPSNDSHFFEDTIALAESRGFEMYEVSNFAKNGNYGKHNFSYWKYEDYYGIGPGAHSRCSRNGAKEAMAQISDPIQWLKWAISPIFIAEKLSKDDEFKEKLIMGLRAKCGINVADFSDRIKAKYDLEKKLRKLRQNSYIIDEDGHVVLTKSGILRLNSIIQFLSED